MVSPSPSQTAHRLRRAKSTSTAHSHRLQASFPGFIDDTTIQDQALIAAMAAFEKANGIENSRPSLDRKTPQRRRSQKSKQMEGEGSHFQASRLQRRQSTKRLSADSTEQYAQGRLRRFTTASECSASTAEYHRRQHDKQTTTNSKHDTLSSTFRRIRKAKSLCSPCDQPHTQSSSDVSMGGEHSMDPAAHTHEYSLQSISETEPPAELSNNGIPSSYNTNFEVDVNILKARDEHLSQFHKHSLRNRPSFLFTPFRKKQDRSEAQRTGSSDNGVTYDDIVSSPLSPVPPPQRKASRENRSLSLSIREKIRRVFRKPSLPHDLPVQHVEAKRYHFGDQFTDTTSGLLGAEPHTEHQSGVQSVEAHSSQSTEPLAPQQTVTRAVSPAGSEATIGTSKSRVTSWTNSTITVPAASRCSNRLDLIKENESDDADMERRGSVGRSKEPNTFRRLMKKASTMDIDASRESNRNSTESQRDSSTRLASGGTAVSGSSLDTLPSQRRRSSLLSARPSQFFRSTVRAVTPDSHKSRNPKAKSVALTPNYRLTTTPAICDLVVKPTEGEEGSSTDPTDSSLPRTRNRLHKVQTKTTKPTADQIACRVERSNDRWKAPLEDGSRSLFYPRSPRGQDKVRSVVPEIADNWPLKCETTKEMEAPESASQLKRSENISPSLYSRGTDSESIPPISAIASNPNGSNASIGSSESNDTGTAIISASTPVASYTVGSSTSIDERPCRPQGSADWRAWLSKKVEDLGTPPPEDITLNSNITIRQKPRTGHRREDAQIVEGEHVTGSIDGKIIRSRTSSRISEEDRPLSRLREECRQASRSSSRMNDRFPMIETGRSSSRNQRKTTPPSNGTPASTQSLQTLSAKRKEKDTIASTIQPAIASGLENLRAVTTREYSNPTQSSLMASSRPTTISELDSFVAESSSPPKPRHQSLSTHKSSPLLQVRPSSALETSTPPNTLRRQPLTSTPTSANKVLPPFDADTTLLSIFKGPYSDRSAPASPLSPSSAAKENACPVALRRSGSAADACRSSSSLGWAPGTPTGGQRLADRFLSERRFRDERRVERLGPGGGVSGSPDAFI